MPTDDIGRAIGKIISVSADRFVLELHRGNDNFTVVGFDDVHYVANLGSFVLIPVQANYVVAEVIGLREKDPTASQTNDVVSGAMDKTVSAKYLDLAPTGMLTTGDNQDFTFGVSTFPPLYADALYARQEDLDAIFQVADDNGTHTLPNGVGLPVIGDIPIAIEVGQSVVFKGYPVKVRLDDYFGGHVAVLGNTGSGKSCTVATVIQSLFEKPKEFVARGASFIVLDVNGEYRPAFSQLPTWIRRKYIKLDADPFADAVNPDATGAEATSTFRLPHWFMSVEEWELLLRASERTQQPVLRAALGLTSLFANQTDAQLVQIKNHILATSIIAILQGDLGSAAKSDRIRGLLSTFSTQQISLDAVREHIAINFGEMGNAEQLAENLNQHLLEDVSIPSYTNKPFAFDALSAALDLALYYEEAHGNRQIRDYCSQMVTRLKWVSQREEFAFLRHDPQQLEGDEADQGLFVEALIGLQRNGDHFVKDTQLTILDLNDAADEVVEIAAAVVARLVFERLKKATPRNQLPVHLVLEEAHRYIAQKPSRYAIDASYTYERIAKEGRKYGVFLKVSSQRPSELSRTVLSQCSNFVVHRIQNPDDLTHIRQMTPFISETVLRRLPSLPKQHALIFGNAVNIPTTFKVRNVDPKPDSNDAQIRKLWFQPHGQSQSWPITE